MDKSFRLGLERALLEYQIVMNPDNSGSQRQRATEIDAKPLVYASRMFELGKSIGLMYYGYVDERFPSARRQYLRERETRQPTHRI